jgi:hypothetical protein
MRNSLPDGVWKFDEIGIRHLTGIVGNFEGQVEIEDGEISTVWLTMHDGTRGILSPNTELYRLMIPQLLEAIPALADWQSGGRANLTAHSRAKTREAAQ